MEKFNKEKILEVQEKIDNYDFLKLFKKMSEEKMVDKALEFHKRGNIHYSNKELLHAYQNHYLFITFATFILKKGKDMKYINVMMGKEMKDSMTKLEMLTNECFQKDELEEKRVSEKAKAELKSKQSKQPDFQPNRTPSKLQSGNGANGYLSSSDEKFILKPDAQYEPATLALRDSISSTELNHTVGSDKSSVLLIDCRSEAEFSSCTLAVTMATLINVPPELNTPGLSAGKLGEKLCEKYRTLWGIRSTFDMIVLFDQYSRVTPNSKASSLERLLIIIKEFDVNTKYKASPLLLEGGFDSWFCHFPYLTTNPTQYKEALQERGYQLPNQTSLNDINYSYHFDTTPPEPDPEPAVESTPPPALEPSGETTPAVSATQPSETCDVMQPQEPEPSQPKPRIPHVDRSAKPVENTKGPLISNRPQEKNIESVTPRPNRTVSTDGDMLSSRVAGLTFNGDIDRGRTNRPFGSNLNRSSSFPNLSQAVKKSLSISSQNPTQYKMDKVEYRRPSLARLYKEDKSYKDNFSRSYNSENIEKILSRTRSLINDFDSGKGSSTNSSSYSTLPPRFRLTGSKYSSSFISSPGGARSFKSRSPASSSSYSSYTSPSYSSLSSIRSPSLSRRSIPSLRSPSPSPSDSVPSSPRILNDLCIPKKSSEKLPNGLPPDCGGRKRSEPPERSPSRRLETGRVENSKPVTNGDSPICNGLDNVAGTSVSTYSRRRSSGAHAPPTSGLSGSNSVKYERCYNELLSRINQIKMNGGETLHEGRTSSNVPEFDRTKKPTQDRVSHYERRENSVAGTNVGPGLTGLKNLGNTCYINSILQCLSNTTPLRQFFQSEFRRSFTCRSPGTGRPGTGCRLAEEFQVIFNMLWAGDTRYFSPNRFKDEVGKMKRTFRGYEQQDSHEFLTILMDSLHEDLKEPESKTVLSGACVESGEKSWGEFLTRNKSIVSDLFYGQLKSTVICLSCQETSSTFEVFSNVSLPLPSHDHCSLRDCLDLYLKDEEIQGWHCPRCKTKRDARKKLDITKLPPILVLHFKRFTSDGWCRKKQTSVEFPETNLNMVEYTAANSETRDFRYDLYAVSNHYGTMESGHYTAYCKNKYKWYKFDDSDVTEISASKVKSPAAYILFYMSSRMNY